MLWGVQDTLRETATYDPGHRVEHPQLHILCPNGSAVVWFA